ncbi:MAG: hypothetical protein AMJ79_15385, partial [Phycisphaerae bacterium SM23_30]
MIFLEVESMAQQKEVNISGIYYLILFLLIAGVLGLSSCAAGPQVVGGGGEGLRFEVSFPPEYSEGELTGRMFVVITRDGQREPRSQVGRYGPQLLGIDFEQLKPGEKVVIDEGTLGYPIESLRDLPAGEYYVQALLNKYTRFERADGHIVWMHMDQWEGQNWRRSPGNAYSQVQQITHEPG